MKKTPKKAAAKKSAAKKLETIEARFLLDDLRMLKLRWQAKMVVQKILNQTYHDYKIKMSLDESPYLKTIDDLEAERKQIGRGQQTLLPEMMEARKTDLHDKIVDERQRLQEMQDKCKKIEFIGVVKELKYNGGDSAFILSLPDNVIEEINQMKYLLNYYKIELTPVVESVE